MMGREALRVSHNQQQKLKRVFFGFSHAPDSSQRERECLHCRYNFISFLKCFLAPSRWPRRRCLGEIHSRAALNHTIHFTARLYNGWILTRLDYVHSSIYSGWLEIAIEPIFPIHSVLLLYDAKLCKRLNATLSAKSGSNWEFLLLLSRTDINRENWFFFSVLFITASGR